MSWTGLQDARVKWEREQEQLHGCKYEDGCCRIHGAAAPVPKTSTTDRKKGTK